MSDTLGADQGPTGNDRAWTKGWRRAPKRPGLTPRGHSNAPARPAPRPRPRWTGPVAAVVAATVGLGGMAAAEWVSSDNAEAVSYQNGWDGVFRKDQLWLAPGDRTHHQMIENPGQAPAANFHDAWKVAMSTTGTANGDACSWVQWNVAVGPLMARRGHDDLIGLFTSYENSAGRIIYQGNCYSTGGLPPSGAAFSTHWGGEVNQKNGLYYAVRDAWPDFSPSGSDPGISIVGVDVAAGQNPDPNSWAASKPTFAWTEYAHSPSTVPPAGASLSDVAKAKGWGSQSGSWRLTSDMAIDANGNAYFMARSPSDGHWVLLRINVPHDANGMPLSTGWTYNVAKTFEDTGSTSTMWGMAFMDGLVYTASESDRFRRWNPLAGTSEDLGSYTDPVDLGSAQMAPVVSGKVYHDAAGDGSVAGDQGVSGATLEVFRADSNGALVLEGNVTTDTDGSYSALLPSASSTFYLRLKQPTVGGANARQTYASAGAFVERGQANTLTAYCATDQGDYQPLSQSGACGGARRDGIDPTAVTNPLAAAGGAAILSRIDMTTDLAVVTADFGVTTAGSWGDAPDAYRTSNSALGPYANPQRLGQGYLYLGAAAAVTADGDPSPAADSHASDDGLEIAPIQSGQAAADRQWAPAQGQLMVAGKQYAFRAKAGGDPAAVAAARVRAWISTLTSAGATATTFGQTLLGDGATCSDTPDQQGYVYCDYTAPTSLPTGGIAHLYARARVGAETQMTATSRGTANPATSPWQPVGEVEDYQLGVAGAVLRIQARTLGDTPAHVALTASNVSTVAPSSATSNLLTNAASTFTADRAGHALVNRGAPVTITTAGVGAAGATGQGGWRLAAAAPAASPGDTTCYDSATGAGLGAVIDQAAGTVTVPVPASGKLPQDVTCQLTYVPEGDSTKSTIKADPSDNADQPLTVLAGRSDVELSVFGQVHDQSGQLTAEPAVGERAVLTLAPIPGTGATATGASFERSADSGATWTSAGQSLTCEIGPSGGCADLVRVVGATAGGYNLKAQIGSGAVLNAATNLPSDASPVPVCFKAAAASPDNSSMTITRTARQYANHDAPGLDPDDWGVQTITVTLRDQNNSPYQDATAPGALIASAPANGSQGVHYGATTGTAGQFACAVEPVGGACPGGVYTLAVHAATAGDKPITVTYAAGGKTFTLSDAATGAGHVVASFATPPASAADSVFIFNGPGETAPQDDWDDPADEPDGVGVVHPAGHTFHPAIRVWDAGRNNPVEGASVRFRVDASCPASFTGVGVEAGAKTVLATTSDLGKAVVGLTSDAVAACQVHGELRQDGRWVALPGGDADPWVKTAEWRDAKVDLAASSFTVSTGDVVANGLDAGTVSVTLVGANSLPVTTAQGALAAYGPDGEGVSVGAFHHVGGGVYEAPLTGTKAGYKLISVEVGGEALAVAVGRNDTAHLVAGPAEADTSWLVQSDLKATADGLATVAVRVRAIDAHGNPATHGEVVFTIPAGVTAAGKTGPDTVAAAVSDGWARLDAASTTAGRYGVTAAIGGQAVTSVKTAAGADLAEDGLAWAEFTAGKASAEASALSIPTAGQDGLTTKLVGGAEKHRAEVLVRDSKLNPLVGGTAQVVFRYSYTDAAGRAQSGASAPVATDAEGVAAWEFSSQAAATWTVTARVVGGATDVAGSPATAAFRAGALDEAATLATFTVDGAAKKTDGVAYAAAQMRATDQFGNPIPQVELGFELDYPVGNGPLFDHAQTGARTATRVSGADGWVEARIYSLWPDDVLVRGRLGQAVTNPREVHFSSTPASAAKSSFAVAAKAGNAAYPQARADGQDAYLVTVTLRDTEGVPLNAATATVVMTPLDAPGATAVEAPVVSGQTGTGQAQVPLQTLRAGTWEVRVRLGQDEVGTAADPAVTAVPVEFVPGPASPAHSRLASPTGRAKADGAETQVVEALVEDANGNAVGGQAVTFAVPAGVTAHPAGGPPVDGPVELLIDTEPGDGAARLVLTSLKTGAFEVTARLAAGRITTGAPAVATFANADLSPARSEFDITTMPGAKTVVTQFHTARVVVRDASGNVYSESVPVAFAYRAQGAQQWIAGPTVNSSAGVAEWSDFTVSRAGVYEVRANLPTGQIPDAHTTKPAEFNPGPADPKASTFRATGGDVAADGQATHAATVEVRDSHGNLVSGQPVTFTLPETGPARFATATCQPTVCQVDSSDLGLAEVELVSGSPATAHLEAAFEAALVGQADLAFKVGAPDPAQSSWSVEPGGALTADGIRAFTATVTVRDAAGHPVPDAAVSFDLPAQVALSWAGAPLTDAQGQVAVLLTSEVAGVHTVKAKLGATAISPTQGRQVTFVAGDISEDPDQTFLTAPPSSAVADGQETQAVTATVRDAKGNPVTDAEVRFGFPAGASSTGPTTVPVDADGQAELVLVSTKAASYPVTAEARRAGDADWTAIKGGAPAAAVFTAGPVSPSHSRISKVEDGPLAADGLAAYTIKVELKDQHDNPRREAGTPVTVEFRLHRADGSAAADVAPVVRGLVTDVDGVATTAFATTRAGTWRAVGVIGSGTVGNSPVEAAFTPGAASAGASQFTVTSGNVLADGEARHRATVVAKDLNGNLVPGARVAFSVEAGAPGVGGPDLVPADGAAVAGADGVAHVDITSREAGSFQVSAVIDGATVAGAPRPVSFDSGAGDPAKSSYALTPDTAAAPTVSVTASGTAADAYALTVTVRSSAGLPVPGARVRLAGLDTAKVLIAEAGGVNGVTGDPASGAYGQHTWHLYSATAGTFEGRVALDTGADVWANIAPAPFALRFGADTADAQASWLTAPAGPVTADGATTAEVEAHVNDAHGNAVDTGQVEFSIPAGLTAVVGQEETVGGSGVAVSAPVRSGLAAVALKSTAAGVHHVSASIGGEAITLVMSADGLSELRRDGIVPVTFTAGRAVADHSSLTVPTAAGGATAVADGSAKHRAEATTRDAFGNPVGGAQVMFRYGPDEAHLTERTVASDPVSGVAAVEFASAEAATYQVSAYVAGSPVAGSPAQAAFVAGPFDPAATLASFEVQDSAAMATGRHPLWVRMRAQDAHGNPVAGITLGFAVTATGNGPVFTPLADGAKQAQGTSGDDGWVTAYLVSEFQGFYPVVGVSGADRTQPKTVTFNNDSASAGQSWFSVERGTANLGQPAIANGSDSYKVTINLRNRDGHPLNGVQALVRVTDQATGQVTEDTVTSSQVAGQSGTAEFFVRTVVAGAYWVNVELGGDDLAQPTAGSGSRAAEVLFTAGPPSSAKSYLVGPATGPAKADGNESQVVAAHLLDANSNPVTGQDVLFTVPAGTTATDLAEGAAPVDGPVFLAVKSDATGVAELTLVSRLKGVYQVRASAGGISLTRGSPAEAVFTNAALAAGESVFTVPTASAAKTVRREFHTPRVELFDASHNLYTDASAEVFFRWRLAGTSAWSAGRTVPSVDGVALWPSWTVSQAGDYEIQAWLESGQVGTTLTARFKVDQAAPEASQFSSSAGSVVLNDATAAHFAQVLVLDAVVGGNPVESVPVTFTVTGQAQIVGAPGNGQTIQRDSSDLGLSRVEIVDAAIGGEVVTVTALVGGLEVGSAELEFRPGAPDPARTTLDVRPTTPLGAAHAGVVADGADSWTAVVTVRDSAGRPVAKTDVTLAPTGPVRVVEPGPHTTNSSGQVTVTLVSAKAGRYAVGALLGSSTVTPAEAPVEFVPGPVSPVVSYLEGPAASAVANGQDPLTVRAYVLDARSNPLTGASVRFQVPAGLTVAGQVDGPEFFDALTDGSGRAELTLTTTRADVYEITAAARPDSQAEWTSIEKNSPSLATFVAGPISTLESQLGASPAGPLVVGGSPAAYQVYVELLDQFANPVHQAQVPIQYRFFYGAPQTDPGSYCRQAPDSLTQFGSALTDATGRATVPFTSTKAGPWYGCAFYAGDRIVGGSPVPLVFEANAADPVVSALEVSLNPVLADGASAHFARVAVTDTFGNPLGGQPVSFAIETGAAALVGPFVKGTTAATALVTSCAAGDEAAGLARCFVNGVFQPGLAAVELVSREPGTFLVSAKLGDLPVSGSPAAVSFTAGLADALKSSWAITPDTADAAAGATVSIPAGADPADSYALTVQVRSASDLPVAGAPVRLAGLPDAVTAVGSAGGSGGPGGSTEGVSGELDSDLPGGHTWLLHSLTAGEFQGQVEIWQDGGWAPVGGEFTVRFGPGPISPESTAATFETFDGSVANNLSDRSWARVVVTDVYGNPVPGVEVAFELPATWPGAAGTPVFTGADGAASGKKTVVTSCPAEPADPAQPSAECLVGGVHTPGLALVNMVSAHEGAFPVSARVGAGADGFAAGSGDVLFDGGAGEADASSFALAPTDAAAERVVADGVASYTLTATVNNRVGSALAPVAGACVAPRLADGLSVADPAASDGCPVGAYPTDAAGRAVLRIVSTRAGLASVGLDLGAEAVATEVGGSEYLVPALFTGGAPAGGRTELTSPADSARADDPAGLAVTATVRDAQGNLAACWDGARPVACQVEFSVPAGAWVPVEGGDGVVGPVRVVVDAGLVDYDAGAGAGDGGAGDAGVARLTLRGQAGSHAITATVDGQAAQVADGVDWAPAAAAAVVVFTDSTAPAGPVLDPSNGSSVGGSVSAEDLADAAAGELTVVVTDSSGAELAVCQVGEDGAFDCPISPALGDGAAVSVEIVDAAGNPSEPVVVLVDAVAPVEPELDASDGSSVSGSVAGDDLADAADGELTAVVADPSSGLVVAECPVGPDGVFECALDPALADGAEVSVSIVDAAGNASEPAVILVDAVAPAGPSLDPSDGSSVSGSVAEGDLADADDGELTVVVTDPSGLVLAECPVGPDGAFECALDPALADGAEVLVSIADAAGNASDPVVVVADAAAPAGPVLDPSNGTSVGGSVADSDLADAAAGDLTAVVTDPATGEELCRTAVGADGRWACDFEPPLEHGRAVEVTVVDQVGNVSDPVVVTADSAAPAGPVLDPSNGTSVGGSVADSDLADAAAGDLTAVVTDPATGEELCRTAVGADGRWACDFEPPLEHGRAVEVTVVDRAQNASDGGSLAVDATPPSGVTVAPTDGRQVTGAGETPGDVITVRDAGGQVLCRVVVGAELTWACALEPVAAEGDILTIAAEDQFGNRVESAWRVGLPRLDLAEPVLRAGARQTATARNYQPGETVALNPDATSSAAQPGAGSTDMADAVVAVLTASEGASGAGSADTSDAALSAVADANGTVVFAWTVPADTAPGERLVEARGAVSGAANARFAVEQPANSGPALTSPTLPFTGAEGVVGLIGLAGGLLLAGALLLLATRRRRQSTPDRP